MLQTFKPLIWKTGCDREINKSADNSLINSLDAIFVLILNDPYLQTRYSTALPALSRPQRTGSVGSGVWRGAPVHHSGGLCTTQSVLRDCIHRRH